MITGAEQVGNLFGRDDLDIDLHGVGGKLVIERIAVDNLGIKPVFFTVAPASTETSNAASRISPGAIVPRKAVSSLLVNGSTALIRACAL